MSVTRHVIEQELDRFLKIFVLKYLVGILDPRKLIELKINHMNIIHMKIFQIMEFYPLFFLLWLIKPHHE